jgi:hypothetical protein
MNSASSGSKSEGELSFTLVQFSGQVMRAFNKRGTVSEELFHAQVQRIENSKVIQTIEPFIINTFDENEEFKNPATGLTTRL